MKLHKWLLVVSLSLFLVACTEEPVEETQANEPEAVSTEELIERAKEEATGEDYEQAQKEQEQQEEIEGAFELPTFTVGEKMVVSEPQGDILEVIVTSVTDRTDALPDYLQRSDYYNWENLITIDVQYTNIDMPDNTSIGLHDFQAYDENGMIMDFINQQSGGDEVSKGRTGTSKFYIEYEEPQDTIELDFILNGETLGTVIAEVKH